MTLATPGGEVTLRGVADGFLFWCRKIVCWLSTLYFHSSCLPQEFIFPSPDALSSRLTIVRPMARPHSDH